MDELTWAQHDLGNWSGSGRRRAREKSKASCACQLDQFQEMTPAAGEAGGWWWWWLGCRGGSMRKHPSRSMDPIHDRLGDRVTVREGFIRIRHQTAQTVRNSLPDLLLEHLLEHLVLSVTAITRLPVPESTRLRVGWTVEWSEPATSLCMVT